MGGEGRGADERQILTSWETSRFLTYSGSVRGRLGPNAPTDGLRLSVSEESSAFLTQRIRAAGISGGAILVPLTSLGLPPDLLPRRAFGERRPEGQEPDLGGAGLVCRLGRFAACLPLADAHPQTPATFGKRARVASGDRPEPTEAAAETTKLFARLWVLLRESACPAPLGFLTPPSAPGSNQTWPCTRPSRSPRQWASAAPPRGPNQ